MTTVFPTLDLAELDAVALVPVRRLAVLNTAGLPGRLATLGPHMAYAYSLNGDGEHEHEFVDTDTGAAVRYVERTEAALMSEIGPVGLWDRLVSLDARYRQSRRD